MGQQDRTRGVTRESVTSESEGTLPPCRTRKARLSFCEKDSTSIRLRHESSHGRGVAEDDSRARGRDRAPEFRALGRSRSKKRGLPRRGCERALDHTKTLDRASPSGSTLAPTTRGLLVAPPPPPYAPAVTFPVPYFARKPAMQLERDAPRLRCACATNPRPAAAFVPNPLARRSRACVAGSIGC